MKRFNVRYELVLVNGSTLSRDVLTVPALDEEGAKEAVRKWEQDRAEGVPIKLIDFISVDEVPKLGIVR